MAVILNRVYTCVLSLGPKLQILNDQHSVFAFRDSLTACSESAAFYAHESAEEGRNEKKYPTMRTNRSGKPETEVISHMTHYIVLCKWTDQGIRNIKDSSKRAAAAKALIEKLGGKWLGFYYTFGQYDMVLIAEGLNDENVMTAALAIGSQGSIRSTTLKAFTEAEAAKLIEKLP